MNKAKLWTKVLYLIVYYGIDSIVSSIRLYVYRMRDSWWRLQYRVWCSWYTYRHRTRVTDRLEGHCIHGHYVGGMGIDYICGWCEDGWTIGEYMYMVHQERRYTAYRDRCKAVAHLIFRFMPSRFGILSRAMSYVGRYYFAKGTM